MQEITLTISGMSCEHCVKRVRKGLDALSGILNTDVTVGKAVITYDESKLSADEIKKAVETAGYTIVRT
jgi:copper chaperone